MSDEQHQRLSADDEELVRRTLAASAPGPAAMPDEVARRLDDVLTGLVAERAEHCAPAPLPAREPRPRRWPNVLVAAAVLSVVALGVGTLTRLGTGASGDNAASAPAADAPAGATVEKAAPDAESGASRSGPLPRLHRDSLQADVERVLARQALVDRMVAGSDAPEGRLPEATSEQCALPEAAGADRLLAVRLDRERATLVLRRARDGVQEAQVYACDDPVAPVVTTAVPSR